MNVWYNLPTFWLICMANVILWERITAYIKDVKGDGGMALMYSIKIMPQH